MPFRRFRQMALVGIVAFGVWLLLWLGLSDFRFSLQRLETTSELLRVRNTQLRSYLATQRKEMAMLRAFQEAQQRPSP